MTTARIIIDARDPSEFAAGHIDGALNIPPQELLSGSGQLQSVPKDAEIIVYCRTGSRSSASIQVLKRMGYTKLVNGINMAHVSKKYLGQ
jgi:phage shock protein E